MPNASVTLTLPTLNTNLRVAAFHLTQQTGMHEIGLLEVGYPLTTPRNLLTDGTPIAVTHGIAPYLSTFYGYVAGHQAVPNYDDENRLQQQYIEYILIGTSSPMQNAKDKAWQDPTPSYIAREIARVYGLVPDIDVHTRRLGFRSQAGTSDFRFLCAIASEVGYDTVVSGPYLRFKNPLAVLDDASVATPTFTMDKQLYVTDSLLDFVPALGELVPDGGINAMRVSNVALADGSVVSVLAGDGSITVRADSKPLRGLQEALHVSEASALRASRWEAATARCVGDARVSAATPVVLTGAALANDHTGVWVAEKVEHIYRIESTTAGEQRYWMSLSLQRDRQRPVPNNQPRAVVGRAQVQMVYLNGAWRPTRVEGGYAV